MAPKLKPDSELSTNPASVARRERRRKIAEEAAAKAYGEERIEDFWVRQSRHLLKGDPALYASLEARHEVIVDLETELVEIERGVGTYSWPHTLGKKRAETLSADTLDPENVFPDPCVLFRDIKRDVLENGVLNYREIETMRSADAEDFRPTFDSKFDGSPEDAYRRFGFKSKLESEHLTRIREALVIYALTCKEPNLDQHAVEEAIADCSAHNLFTSHGGWVRELIREHRLSQFRSNLES